MTDILESPAAPRSLRRERRYRLQDNCKRSKINEAQIFKLCTNSLVTNSSDVHSHWRKERTSPFARSLQIKVSSGERSVVAKNAQGDQEELKCGRVCAVNSGSFDGVACLEETKQILNQRAVQVLEESSGSTES